MLLLSLLLVACGDKEEDTGEEVVEQVAEDTSSAEDTSESEDTSEGEDTAESDPEDTAESEDTAS